MPRTLVVQAMVSIQGVRIPLWSVVITGIAVVIWGIGVIAGQDPARFGTLMACLVLVLVVLRDGKIWGRSLPQIAQIGFSHVTNLAATPSIVPPRSLDEDVQPATTRGRIRWQEH